jgi:hypothetical protein
MEKPFGNVSTNDASIFNEIYKKQSEAVVSKDMDTLKNMRTDNFVTVGTDGKEYHKAEWAQDVQFENEIHDYSHNVYSINKVNIDNNGNAVVHATRRSSGINNARSPFTSSVDIIDEWIKDGDDFKLNKSETVGRKLFINGQFVGVGNIHGPQRVLLQGCGDDRG